MLGVLPGIIGTIQAVETVKLITGIGEPLFGRLLLFDAMKMKFREMKPRKDPKCPICGPNRTIHELIDYEQFCGMPAVEGIAPVPHSNGVPEITVGELKGYLDAKRDFDLVDVREPQEYEIARIPGARLIPLGELPRRIHELDSSREIVLHCKVGARSAKAGKLLYDAGFRKIKNVAGGIDAWSHEIDPSVPAY